jgi:hypothetical protein
VLALSGTDAEALRTLLSERHQLELSPMCERAAVVVTPVDDGYRLSLTLGGDQVAREVATLLDCATWIETWLAPLDQPTPPQGEVTHNDDGPPSTSGQREIDPRQDRLGTPPARTPDAAPSVLGRLTLAGVAAGAEDGTLWGGGELFGQLVLYDRFWFGAAAAGLEDLSTRTADERIRRRLARASIRVGGRWRPTALVVLDAGFGAGLLSALTTIDTGGEYEDEDEGAGFGEVTASVGYGLSDRWQIVVALTLAGIAGIGERDADEEGLEALLPAAHPDFLGGLVVGVGCDVARLH